MNRMYIKGYGAILSLILEEKRGSIETQDCGVQHTLYRLAVLTTGSKVYTSTRIAGSVEKLGIAVSMRNVAAQVEFIASSADTRRGQPGVNLGLTQGQVGVNLIPTWGRHGVERGSTEVNLGSTGTAIPSAPSPAVSWHGQRKPSHSFCSGASRN